MFVQVKDATKMIYTDQMGRVHSVSSAGHKYIAATDKVSWLEMPSILAESWQHTAKLLTTSVQNTAWIDTDGPPGACNTLKHHSLDPYGGHEIVQQQLIRCHGLNCHQVWLRVGSTLPNFSPHQSKTWHGLTQMGHQELVAHQSITHWIHMEDMKWFSSN
jgi:hypothetical protein